MDRFIDQSCRLFPNPANNLKSNMDRFIVEPFCQTFALNVYLKSNMDRFIVRLPIHAPK